MVCLGLLFLTEPEKEEMKMASLSLQHICKAYPNGFEAVKDFNLEIEDKEFIIFVGPSGCGKSTLLRCINGLESINDGVITLEGVGELGKDISWTKVRGKIGMVFQSYELFSHMNVIDNILLGPLKVQKRKREEVEAKADKLLEKVGLLDRKKSFPRELSGGQKQRIAIVRALCMNPDIMLFDEVTAALDPEMVREVLEVIQALAKDGMTMIVVTHEMSFARKVANKIAFMDEGKIVEITSPEEFFTNPKTERARLFLNILNYLFIRLCLYEGEELWE